MKLGTDFPQAWKMKSEQDGIPLSDILYGYAIENLLIRIEESSFGSHLWLVNESAIGEEAYKKVTKECLEYLYGHTEHIKTPLRMELVKQLADELVSRKEDDMIWSYELEKADSGFHILLVGSYMDMKVPIKVKLEEAPDNAYNPIRKELQLLFEEKETCVFLSFSRESVLSGALFEIMRKLELISDMEAYSIANEIIKTQFISGRHIMEDFRWRGGMEPKVLSRKRLEQIASYKKYAYMRKKWQQYEKRHNKEAEDWEQVLDRILSFIKPIWEALCDDEIFLDDWMPELGRFLG